MDKQKKLQYNTNCTTKWWSDNVNTSDRLHYDSFMNFFGWGGIKVHKYINGRHNSIATVGHTLNPLLNNGKINERG